MVPYPQCRLSAASEALLRSASEGDVGGMLDALADGADLEATDGLGCGAMHLAAGHGTTSAVRLLLEKGAAVDRPNADGLRPLQLAALYGQTANAEALLNAGAPADDPEWEFPTASLAASCGHAACLLLLLERGCSPASVAVDAWASVLTAARVDQAIALVPYLSARNRSGVRDAIVERNPHAEAVVALDAHIAQLNVTRRLRVGGLRH